MNSGLVNSGLVDSDLSDAAVMEADVVVVGAGLAGLVATAELIAAGKSVIGVEQESAQNFGGQAFWSFGGIFLVDFPEQRRMGIRDSVDLGRRSARKRSGVFGSAPGRGHVPGGRR